MATMEENSSIGWETRLKTSEVLSNSKSMNSSFLLSKQNTWKCFACSKLTLPTKANSDVNGPKIPHNLTSSVKPFSCFRILAFVLNFSFQGQSPLRSILVAQGREGCLGFFRKSHVRLKQSHKWWLPWEAPEVDSNASQWQERVCFSSATPLACFNTAWLIIEKVLSSKTLIPF